MTEVAVVDGHDVRAATMSYDDAVAVVFDASTASLPNTPLRPPRRESVRPETARWASATTTDRTAGGDHVA